MWVITALLRRSLLTAPGRAFGAMLALGIATPSSALELSLPFSAQLTTRVVTAPDSHALPVGAFAEGGLPVLDLEGQVERQVFRFAAQALTTLQLLVPLRDQLDAAGYEILFECDSTACGGFDFRFATEVLPAPDMYVDLTDFRFLAARRGARDHIGLLVSTSANAGFVQMIRVTSDPEAAALRVSTPVTSLQRPAIPNHRLRAQTRSSRPRPSPTRKLPRRPPDQSPCPLPKACVSGAMSSCRI